MSGKASIYCSKIIIVPTAGRPVASLYCTASGADAASMLFVTLKPMTGHCCRGRILTKTSAT